MIEYIHNQQGSVFGSCGHKLTYDNVKLSYGHSIAMPDVDRTGAPAIAYYVVCDECLEHHKASGDIIEDEEKWWEENHRSSGYDNKQYKAD